MFSTLLELAGFAAMIAATYLVAGLVGALYVTGPVLLLLGYAAEDERALLAVRRVLAPARRHARAVADRRAQRKRRRVLAKAA